MPQLNWIQRLLSQGSRLPEGAETLVKLQPTTGRAAAASLRGPELQQTQSLINQLYGNQNLSRGALNVLLEDVAPEGSFAKGALGSLLQQPRYLALFDPNARKMPSLASRRSENTGEQLYDLLYDPRMGPRVFAAMIGEEYSPSSSKSYKIWMNSGKDDASWNRALSHFDDVGRNDLANKWFLRGDRAEEMLDEIDPVVVKSLLPPGKDKPYAWNNYQRLITDEPKNGYFESVVAGDRPGRLGVKRRSLSRDPYDIYGEESPERFYTEKPWASPDDNVAQFFSTHHQEMPTRYADSAVGHLRGTSFNARAASKSPTGDPGMFIEEVQSDPLAALSKLKGNRELIGPQLQDAYRLLGRAAVGLGAAKKAPSVWFPTAQAIGELRGGKDFSKIYDDALVNGLLNPLAEHYNQQVQTGGPWRGLDLPTDVRQDILKNGVPYAFGGRV